MRIFICVLLIFTATLGYSQRIMLGHGYDAIIEYLEETGCEWSIEEDSRKPDEGEIIIEARHYFGRVYYFLSTDSDFCWYELRYLNGVSKANYMNFFNAKFDQTGCPEWADFSHFGSSHSLMVIHEILIGEDAQPGWRISMHNNSPVTAKGFYGRSRARFNDGYFNEAVKDYNNALKLDEDYPLEDYAEVIKTLILVGENEAVELFNSVALGFDYGSVDYWIAGMMNAYGDNSSTALQAFSKTLDMDPDFGAVYYYRGIMYSFLGSPEKAIADFTAYIDKFPEAYDAIRRRGYLRWDIGEDEMAVSDLEMVLNAFPDNARIMSDLAHFKAYLGQYSESLELLEKSILLDPDLAHSYHIKGMVYLSLKDTTDKALSNFNKAIALDHGNFMAHHLRGTIYKNMERNIEAVEEFSRAIELQPLFLDSYFSRALVKSEMEDRLGAIDDYRELLKHEEILNGNFLWGTVYNNIGYSYLEIGQYEEARSFINKALEMEPDEHYIWSSSGELHYLTGEYEKCISDMDMAIILKATDMTKAPELGHEVSFFYRGLAKIKLNNPEEGCIDLRHSHWAGNPEAEGEMKLWCE